MNCQTARKQVMESCAGGVATFPPGLRAHLESCVECRLFCEHETDLFAALDTGLQNLANYPVPTSLLPSLRAALEQMPARRSLFVTAWGLAALAAALALVISLNLLSSRMQRRAFQVERQVVAFQPERPPEPKTSRHLRVAVSNANRRTKAATIPLARKSESRPEVIVLTEEREAFAQFLADRAREPLELVAAPKALEKSELAVDIALLTIKKVEIQPIEGTVED